MKYDSVDSPKGDIMVVDDTPANLRLLSEMLAEQGYHVRPVTEGSLALSAVKAEPPDLILLDIRMPGMNGYEVCEHLKAETPTCDIPVIFISALDAIQDKIKAFNTGGADYVTKPFQLEEVLARVETHLSLRKLQKQLEDANKKMAQELALAGEVQTSFLPRNCPEIPGWQLSATLRPARETSGDFYDIITLPNHCFGIVVADVCDKGAGAALYMALCWTLIRTFAADSPTQPERVLSAVNQRIIKDTKTDQFITVFYGIIDVDSGKFYYCNAGHCTPYQFSSNNRKKIRLLSRTGTALGISAEMVYEQRVVQLFPGDGLVLYTDGITEALNEHGVFLGTDRLLEAIKSNSTYPAGVIQDAILADVQDFVGEMSQSDDIALVILLRDPIS